MERAERRAAYRGVVRRVRSGAFDRRGASPRRLDALLSVDPKSASRGHFARVSSSCVRSRRRVAEAGAGTCRTELWRHSTTSACSPSSSSRKVIGCWQMKWHRESTTQGTGQSKAPRPVNSKTISEPLPAYRSDQPSRAVIRSWSTLSETFPQSRPCCTSKAHTFIFMASQRVQGASSDT